MESRLHKKYNESSFPLGPSKFKVLSVIFTLRSLGTSTGIFPILDITTPNLPLTLISS